MFYKLLMKESATSDIVKLIKELWALFAGLIGAITVLFNFLQLWKGNKALLTWISVGFGLLALFVSLLYIGFSKSDSPVLLATAEPKKIHKYPQYYKLARVCIGILILSIAICGWFLNKQIQHIEEQIVILVAKVDGPNQTNFRVTEKLLSELRKSFDDFDEILIIPLDYSISEQQGNKEAKRLGVQNRADLVIWGWYGTTESNVLVTINIENLVECFLPYI